MSWFGEGPNVPTIIARSAYLGEIGTACIGPLVKAIPWLLLVRQAHQRETALLVAIWR